MLIYTNPKQNLIQLDLSADKWVYREYWGSVSITNTSSYNDAFIKRWKNQNNLDVVQKLVSELSPMQRELFAKRCWVLISREQSTGCYGFFFKLSYTVGPSVFTVFKESGLSLKELGDVHKALVAARKSPICYLHELMIHFDLPAHSGFKYLSLFRLFVISDQDPVTEFKNKK